MLKQTGVKLELLTDPEMYAFFEESIRGGVSMISKWLADANNKYLPNYDENKESSYIMDLDANGLYASTMSDPLPVSGFKWLCKREINVFEGIARKGLKLAEDTGASFSVDLEYPRELHDLHNEYPLAPEKILVNDVEKHQFWGTEKNMF